MAKLSERQKEQVEYDRALEIYKRDDMIQKARFRLTPREQKCVAYAISKIKPEDDAFTEITVAMKDFCQLCGLEGDSYTELKDIMKSLRDRSWWIKTESGADVTVSWFNKVRMSHRGEVTIRFDDDMMPFLLKLAEQGTYYTSYSLQHILPMQSQYSPRLYEILKSYQKNNKEWFFDIEELKVLLDCQKYKNFKDFRRRALEPAVEEINKYSDLNVAYHLQKEGRRVARVVFFLNEKSPAALTNVKKEIAKALDDENPDQMTVFDLMGDEHDQAWRTAQEQFRRINRGEEQE